MLQKDGLGLALLSALVVLVLGFAAWTLFGGAETAILDREEASPAADDVGGVEGPRRTTGEPSGDFGTVVERPRDLPEPPPRTPLIPGELEVRGRVVDESDAPIAGARVRLFPDPEAGGGPIRPAAPIQEAFSDETGAFALRGLVRHECYRLEVRKEGYVDLDHRPIHAAAPETLHPVLHLSRCPTIAGRVIDADGRGLPDALVEVFDSSDLSSTAPAPKEGDSRTRTDGAFTVTCRGPGRKRLLASSPGRASEPRDGVFIAEGQASPFVEIVLGSGASIEGQVVDEASGKPVEGLRISARICGLLIPEPVETKPSKQPGEAPKVSRSAKLAKGSVPPINARLSSIETDGDGRPSIKFAFPPEIRCRAELPVTATTGADGRFSITGLYAAEYLLNLDAEECQDDREWRARPGDHDLVLEVVQRPAIRGRVVDAETGQAIEAFRVLSAPIGDPGIAERMERRSFDSKDGRFTLYPRATDPAFLHVWADGYAWKRLDGIAPQAAPGDEIVINLDRGQGVTGRILDRDGHGIAAAVVTLIDPPSATEGVPEMFRVAKGSGLVIEGLRALTDAEGRFELRSVPAGRFAVAASHPDFAETKGNPFSCSGTGLRDVEDLVLDPGAAVFGRLDATVTGPIRGSRILVAGTVLGDAVRTVPVLDDGSFRCDGLAAGSYRIVLLPPGRPDPTAFLTAMQTAKVVTLTLGEKREAP